MDGDRIQARIGCHRPRRGVARLGFGPAVGRLDVRDFEVKNQGFPDCCGSPRGPIINDVKVKKSLREWMEGDLHPLSPVIPIPTETDFKTV